MSDICTISAQLSHHNGQTESTEDGSDGDNRVAVSTAGLAAGRTGGAGGVTAAIPAAAAAAAARRSPAAGGGGGGRAGGGGRRGAAAGRVGDDRAAEHRRGVAGRGHGLGVLLVGRQGLVGRGVDDAGHAALAVGEGVLGAVEEDGIGGVDHDLEDVGLRDASHRVSGGLDSMTGTRKQTDILSGAGGHKSGEETAGRRGLARAAEVTHDHAVVDSVEVELKHVAHRGCHVVGGEGETVLADVDPDGGSGGSSCHGDGSEELHVG